MRRYSSIPHTVVAALQEEGGGGPPPPGPPPQTKITQNKSLADFARSNLFLIPMFVTGDLHA